MGNIGTLTAHVNADTSTLAYSARQVGTFVNTTSSRMKGLSSSVLGVTAAFAGLTAAGVALTASLSKVVKTGMEFEKTMAVVRGVSRATEEQFNSLTGIASELGRTTEWTANQAAQGLRFLSMAGFEVEKSIKALPGTLDLATAGNIELSRAADIATNALTAMGIEVEDLEKVNDTFVSTITRTNTDMEMMAESFKYAAPVARAFGYTIDEVATFIGLLGNAGVQGSMAGTQLAFAIQKAALYAEEAGIKNAKLIDVLKKLNEERADELKFMDIFSMRGGRAALILKDQIENYYKLNEQVKNSQGESEELAKVMRDTLSNSFALLKSAIDGVAIALYEEVFKEDLRGTIEGITESVSELTKTFIILAKIIKVPFEAVGIVIDLVQGIVYGFSSAIYQTFYLILELLRKLGGALNLLGFDDTAKSIDNILGKLQDFIGGQAEFTGKRAFDNLADAFGFDEFFNKYDGILVDSEKRTEEAAERMAEIMRTKGKQIKSKLESVIPQYNEPFELEAITSIDESKIWAGTFIESKKLMDEFLEDILNKHEKFTQDQLTTYRAMYEDMGKFSKKYYNTQRKLIEAQAKEFEKAGIKENEINQWKYEKLREIRKQELRDTEGFVGGAISYLMDLQDRWENFYTIIGQLGYKTFESLYTAFEDTIFYGIQGKMEELEDVWENTWSNIKDMFFRVIAQMIAKAAISKIILPISTSITGGAVGGGLAGGLAQMAGGMGGASLAGAGFGLGSIIDFTDPGTILSSAGFIPIHDAMVGIADQLGLYGAGAFLSEWSNVIIPGLGGLITLAMGGSPASAIGTTIGGIFGGPLGAIAGGILGQLFTGGAEYPIGTYTQSNFNALSSVYGKSASAWQMGTGISSSGYNALVSGNFGYAGISGGENIIQAYVNARDTVIEGFNQEVLAWLDTVPDSLKSTIEGQLSAIDFSYSFEAIQKNAQNIEQDINEFIENYYNHLVEQYGQILNNIDVQRLIAYTSYMEELQAALDNILLTDEQKEIRALNEWYKAQVNYLESLSLTTEQGLDALSRLNELYQLKVQQITNTMSSSNTSIDELQEFINSIRTSSEYAPALSYEGFQQMYEQLKQGVLTGEEGAVGSLIGYLKSDYLPFMQSYGGDYNDLYQTIFGTGGELETLISELTSEDNPIVQAIEGQTIELITAIEGTSGNMISDNLQSTNNDIIPTNNISIGDDLNTTISQLSSLGFSEGEINFALSVDGDSLIDVIVSRGASSNTLKAWIKTLLEETY